MLTIVYGIILYAFPVGFNFFIIPIVIIIGFIRYYLSCSREKLDRLFILTTAVTILFNYGLNLGILQPLLNYQGPSQAAQYILAKELIFEDIYLFNENKKAKSRSFNYYLNMNTNYIDREYFSKHKKPKSMLIYTGEKGYEELLKLNDNVNIIKTFSHARVSKISMRFLDPSTRSKILKKKYLLECS